MSQASPRRRAGHAGVGVGGQPDRRPRALHGRHRDPHVAQREVPAFVAHGLAAPQPLQDLEPLDQPPDALARLQPERLVLGVAVAEPDADDQPPPADDVHRGQLLRQIDRLEQWQQDHPGAERHPLRLRRHPPQRGKRLKVRERLRQIMLTRPHRLKPDGARHPHLLEMLRKPRHLRLLRPMLNRQGEP
jgi:hypothetical protein